MGLSAVTIPEPSWLNAIVDRTHPGASSPANEDVFLAAALEPAGLAAFRSPDFAGRHIAIWRIDEAIPSWSLYRR